MVTINEIYDSRDTVEEFSLICKKLGYESKFTQLDFNNGASATNLFDFFKDNPDAISALKDWIVDNKEHFVLLTDEDESEEEETSEDSSDFKSLDNLSDDEHEAFIVKLSKQDFEKFRYMSDDERQAFYVEYEKAHSSES